MTPEIDVRSILIEEGLIEADGPDDSSDEIYEPEEMSLAEPENGGNGRLEDAELSCINLMMHSKSEFYKGRLLTQEEEVSLGRRIQAGIRAERILQRNSHLLEEKQTKELENVIEQGGEAGKELAANNIGLVVNIAGRYKHYQEERGLNFADIIENGHIGLMIATRKFDPEKGNKFSTYATWWIRNYITREFRKTSSTVRIPDNMRTKLREYIKTRYEVFADEEIDEDSLREERDLSEREIKTRRQALKMLKLESLNEPINEDKDPDEFGDFIEDRTNRFPDPEQGAINSIMEEDVRSALLDIDPRSARIIRMRYGMDDYEQHNLREIGEKMGLTRERIRQLEAKGLRELRHPRIKRRLEPYSQN